MLKLIKHLLSIMIISTLCTFSHANEFIIDEIKIFGTKRIDNETVIAYSNISVGNIYSEELGNNILKIYLIQIYFQIFKYRLKINN